jgi:RNA polymerase-associated protein RTF1
VKKEVKKKLKTDKDEELARKLAGTRSSARSKDVSGAKSKKAAALAALKRQRKILQDMESSSDGSEEDFGDDDEDSDEDYEEVGLKPWQKKAKAAEKLARSSSISRLDRDGDSDMDIDDDDEKGDAKKAARTKSEPGIVGFADAGLEDFLKVTIPRRRLARWCNEPFFDAAVLECFVRLFIGEDDQGEKVYRLCEIVDVKVDKRSYKFPLMNKNDTPISTNKLLRLKFGNNERDFPMNLVSDTPPTELDVQKYVTTQRNNRAECLSKRRATKLRRTQDHLISTYTYTTEDIERNLLQRKKEGKSMSNLGSAQTKIVMAVQGARDALLDAENRLTEAKKALMEFSGALHEENELEKTVEECTRAVEAAKKDLEDLLAEERAMLTAVKNRTMKLTGRERDQNWAKVNQRALQMNQKVDRESYKVQKELDARKAAGEKEKFNPYARRKVKPKILWEVGQSKDDTAVEEINDRGTTAETPNHLSAKSDAATPVLLKDGDMTTEAAAAALVSESHQFVIDEEGLAAAQLTSHSLGLSSTRGTQSNVKVAQRVRKGMSLTEYLDRKEKGTL